MPPVQTETDSLIQNIYGDLSACSACLRCINSAEWMALQCIHFGRFSVFIHFSGTFVSSIVALLSLSCCRSGVWPTRAALAPAAASPKGSSLLASFPDAWSHLVCAVLGLLLTVHLLPCAHTPCKRKQTSMRPDWVTSINHICFLLVIGSFVSLQLLAQDIRHERNVILQCVRYIVRNDVFGLHLKAEPEAGTETGQPSKTTAETLTDKLDGSNRSCSSDLQLAGGEKDELLIAHGEEAPVDQTSQIIHPADEETWETPAIQCEEAL